MLLLKAKCSQWVADMFNAKAERSFDEGPVDVVDSLPSLS